MRPYQFKTLRARLTALLILPVVMILLAAGVSGFIYARDLMLRQWKETVILQLKRAAHEIEMRLSRPVDLMEMFSQSGSDTPDAGLLEAIVNKLETLPGVVRVTIGWHTPSLGGHGHGGMQKMMDGRRFIRFHRGAFAKISPPTIDERIGTQTVSMTMVLMDAYDTPVGNLEIIIKFDFLMADISSAPWWQDANACIVDKTSGSIVFASGRLKERATLGETGDSLEGRLLAEIDREVAGTIAGSGMPPERIVGFHLLDTFPWALVVFADGKRILAPIITFRKGFIVGAAVNITQRIQGESKEGETVVSGPVIDKVGSRVSVTRTFSATLKGVSAPMNLYAVNQDGTPER